MRAVFVLQCFDHNELKASLRPKMTELNANLERFVSQLKLNGQWESTAIYITSEFARTITPNSNAGSDHGMYFCLLPT